MFNNIYYGRRVFITGHTGFKGSWLCAWLKSLGADVYGYSIGLPSEPANFEALQLFKKIRDGRGDVRDKTQLMAAISMAKPEIVFHLAAQPLVRAAYDDPVTTFETNILGTLNILNVARENPGIKALVIITSDKCYQNREWVWGYRENDTLGGNDPYSASKACAEIISNAWFKSYFDNGTACATTRAGNVIGGGDWAKDRILPDCARAWAKDEPVILRSPNATRPWQLVLEPLSGYLWLGAKLLEMPDGVWRNQAYNFGPPADVKKTVGDVTQELKRFWKNFSVKLAGQTDSNKKESGLLKLCCDKALADLDWRPTLNFEETIRFTAEWYAAYYGGVNNMWDFSLGQIAAYCNLAQMRNLAWTK